MPRKKKDPNEMTDRELIERAFPKRVVKEIDRRIGRDESDENGDSTPDTDEDKD